MSGMNTTYRDRHDLVEPEPTPDYTEQDKSRAVRAHYALLDQLERAEMQAIAADARAIIRDERMCLHAALQRRDVDRIRAAAASAQRVLTAWKGY